MYMKVLYILFAAFLVVGNAVAQSNEYDDETPDTAADALNDLSADVQQVTVPSDNSYVINGTDLIQGPSKDDVAAHMALMIFGKPVKDMADQYFNGLTATTATSNSDKTLVVHLATITTNLALFFTSLLLLGGIGGGLFYTGRDGELLGKDWDHKMFPIRAAWHTSMLVPIPGFGGLCGIQIAVLFLGLLGLGAAGATFRSGVTFLGSGGQIVLYQNQDMVNLSENIIRAAMCDAYSRAYYADQNPGADFYPSPGLSTTQLKTHTYRNGSSRVSGVKFLVGNGQCGTYLVKYVPVNSTTEHNEIVKNAVYKKLVTDGAFADFFNGVVSAVSSETGYANTLVSDVEAAALSTTEMQAIESLRQTFVSDLSSSIGISAIGSDLANANSDFINEASKFGFAFYFRYYYELSQRQEKTSQAVSAVLAGDISVPWDLEVCTDWWDLTCEQQEEIKEVEVRIDRAFADLYQETNVLYTASVNGESLNNSFSTDMIEMLILGAAESLTELPRVMAGLTQPDPIVEVKVMGDAITQFADAVFFLTAKVKAVAFGVKEGAPSITKIPFAILSDYLESIFLRLFASLIPLWGLGFMYANIIPAIPTIFGFVSVFGFFIYWVMAVYHAPFWYAMGAMPKGDGLVGRANSGYSMVVNLVLMPSFIVIGFFSGMVLMKVFGWMVKLGFFEAIADMHSVSGWADFSFSKLIGVLLVYSTVYTILIWKCFGMCFELPNSLGQWMGANNRTDFGETEAKTGALTSAATASQNMTKAIVSADKQDKVRTSELDADASQDNVNADKSASNQTSAQAKSTSSSQRASRAYTR